MFQKKIFFFVLIFLGLFFVKNVLADGLLVQINEIAWMGTEVSSNDEWIELWNASDEAINLDGWALVANDGSPKIVLEGRVEAEGYFLLERTDDESVPGIVADQIYSGSLGNAGEILILKNSDGVVVDEVNAGEGWPMGNNDLKLTMEKIGAGVWQNSAEAGGTPRVLNSGGQIDEEVELDVDEEVNGQEDMNSEIQNEEIVLVNGSDIKEKAEKLGYDYSNTIVISEVFPSPFNSYSDLEYVELYNYGEEDVGLIGWEIRDESGMKYVLNGNIKAGDFFVIYRSESGIALNNNGDTVKLYQPFFDVPLEMLKYDSSKKGTSYGVVDFDALKFELDLIEYEWSDVLTPGKINFYEKKNILPQVEFYCPDEIMIASPQIFDSSDTVDADGDELKFFWDFGDGATNTLAVPEHTFFKAGEFEVQFRVFDGESDVVKTKIIKVIDTTKSANQKPISLVAQANIKEDNVKKDEVAGIENVLIDSFENYEDYNFNVGSRVTVLGIVVVLPGILGSQFFYIVENEESSVGIQVYSYKKDFPDALKVGDLLEVTGEIVVTQGEKRIKTKTQEDMMILSSGHQFEAEEMIIKEIGDVQVGNLITVVGEVVEQKSTYAYVDDGTDELKIYIKSTSGVSYKIFEEGIEVAVTGILSKTSTGFRLMPRFPEDVVVYLSEEDESARVLGASSSSSLANETFDDVIETGEWEIEARDQKLDLFRYLLVIFGAVIVILLVFLLRSRKL